MDPGFDPSKLYIHHSGRVDYDGNYLAPSLDIFFQILHQNNANAGVASGQVQAQFRTQDKTQDSSSDSDENPKSILRSGRDSSPEIIVPYGSDGKTDSAVKAFQDASITREPLTRTVKLQATPTKYYADDRMPPDRIMLDRFTEVTTPGNATVLGKRKAAGFSAEELVAAGALQCNPCRQNNLRTPIAKVFRIENFTDIPTQVYTEVLAPALRLATMFLSDKRVMQFWATLAFGDRVRDKRWSWNTGSFVTRIPSLVQMTEERFLATAQLLDRLGDTVNFSFRDIESERMMFGLEQGLDPLFYHPNGGFNLDGSLRLAPFQSGVRDPWDRPAVVALARDFYTVASSLARLKVKDTAAQLRFNLFFATNICHELAHSFERKCGTNHWFLHLQNNGSIDLGNPDYVSDNNLKQLELMYGWEAIWLQTGIKEMGQAFESTLFGGLVHPVNARVDCHAGLALLYKWPDKDHFSVNGPQNPPPGHGEARSVRMGWAEEVQQQSFWDRKTSSSDFLLIPRTGALAYLTAFTSTTPVRGIILQSEQKRQDQHMRSHSASFDDDRSKRIKLEPEPEPEPAPRRKKLLPTRGRLLSTKRMVPRMQSRLSFPMMQTSQQLRDSMLNAALLADIAVAREREIETQKARFNVDPDADQKALTDYYKVDNASSSDSSNPPTPTDPALKKPEELTLADKWLLAEESFFFLNIPSNQFLNMRISNTIDWRLLGNRADIDPGYSTSWSQPVLDHLLNMRKTLLNGDSFVAQRRDEAAKSAKLQSDFRVWTEIEEYCVLMGYSRIDLHVARDAGAPLPLGITFETWDEHWREKLQRLRDTQKDFNSEQYKEDLRNGIAVPGATGAAAVQSELIAERDRVAAAATETKPMIKNGPLEKLFERAAELEKKRREERVKRSVEYQVASMLGATHEQAMQAFEDAKVGAEDVPDVSDESDNLYEDHEVFRRAAVRAVRGREREARERREREDMEAKAEQERKDAEGEQSKKDAEAEQPNPDPEAGQETNQKQDKSTENGKGKGKPIPKQAGEAANNTDKAEASAAGASRNSSMSDGAYEADRSGSASDNDDKDQEGGEEEHGEGGRWR